MLDLNICNHELLSPDASICCAGALLPHQLPLGRILMRNNNNDNQNNSNSNNKNNNIHNNDDCDTDAEDDEDAGDDDDDDDDDGGDDSRWWRAGSSKARGPKIDPNILGSLWYGFSKKNPNLWTPNILAYPKTLFGVLAHG